MESTQDSVKRGPGLVAALLAFGVFLALLAGTHKALRNHPDTNWGFGTSADAAVNASRLEEVAVLGQAQRTDRTPDFRHAEVSAVMGHAVLDLREAGIQAHEAVVEAFVVMGDATIRVPEDWTVITKEAVVLGAMNNRTRRDKADPEKRLRIEGAVLMGSLTITH